MIVVLSPAKTLDFETPPVTARFSQARFLDDSARLVGRLRGMGVDAIAELMSLSPALAELNADRFRGWSTPFSPRNAKQAVLAFAGDVYEGLDAPSLEADALDWSQDHLRILSGLYGLLRPLDLIQPYRLEMGTRLSNARGRDLYAFWGDTLSRALRDELVTHACPVLINLASQEYFKAVARPTLGVSVVQPVFQERRPDGWKVISFMAKRARGLMARFMITARIDDPVQLKNFDLEGYRFDPEASGGVEWVFRRD